MTSELFWYKKPQVLIEYPYVYNILPNNQESMTSQLNSLSRFVILISCIALLLMPNKKINVLVTLCITLGAIIIFERNKTQYVEPLCNKQTPPLVAPINNCETSTSKKNSNKPSILKKIKSTVDAKLFHNLNDDIDHENFDRNFNILPDTSVDAQKSFIDFCFKNTASDKDKHYASYK